MKRPVPWAKLLTALALCAGYLYYFPFFKHLGNPNENVRVFMVKAVVDHGTFALNQVMEKHGYVDDRSTNRTQRCRSRRGLVPCTYSSKAPGTSYLGVPVYAALKGIYAIAGTEPDLATTIYFLRLLVMLVPSLLFLWAFFRFLRHYVGGEDERLLIVAALGLGTMCYTYAHLFAGHHVVAVLSFSAFMLIERAHRRQTRWPLVLAGLCAFYAAITEYPALLTTVALFAYAGLRMKGRRLKSLALFGAGGVLPCALVLYYHYACFGSPWKTGYSMLANRAFAQYHSVGVLGIGWPSARAAFYTLLSPGRGLFFFSPFLLLALPGMFFLWRQKHRAELGLCAYVIVLYLAYQSAVNPEIGGWSIGPRYIVLVTPFLAFAAAAFVEEVRGRTAALHRLLAVPLALVSILFTFVSTIVFHTFPPAFTNPFFEWVVPLIRLDFFNHSIGTFAGLRGLWSALPGLVPVGALAAALCWGPRFERWETRALAAASSLFVAGLLVAGAGQLARSDTPQKRVEFERLTRQWEPLVVTGEDLRQARARAAARPNDPRAQSRLAELLARLGRGTEALGHYGRAAVGRKPAIKIRMTGPDGKR